MPNRIVVDETCTPPTLRPQPANPGEWKRIKVRWFSPRTPDARHIILNNIPSLYWPTNSLPNIPTASAEAAPTRPSRAERRLANKRKMSREVRLAVGTSNNYEIIKQEAIARYTDHVHICERAIMNITAITQEYTTKDLQKGLRFHTKGHQVSSSYYLVCAARGPHAKANGASR